jgi:hypothetical protein
MRDWRESRRSPQMTNSPRTDHMGILTGQSEPRAGEMVLSELEKSPDGCIVAVRLQDIGVSHLLRYVAWKLTLSIRGHERGLSL